MTETILLIKQTSLGDVVHATAPIRSVRAAFPDAHITVLTSTTAADLFLNNSDIDVLITFDRYRVKSDWWRHPCWTIGHIWHSIRKVRRQEFDLAIDLQGSWKTVMFLWAARTRSRFVKGRWWFAQRFCDPQLHAIDEMNGVLQLCGVQPSQERPILTVSEKDHDRASLILSKVLMSRKKLAVICPMTRWPTKNWSLDNFVELVDEITDTFFVVATGSLEDRIHIDRAFSGDRSESVMNLAGDLSLSEFIAVMDQADVVVAGDSLPMHVASALDRPLVALFGPTNEALVGPKSPTSFVLRADVGCQRCYRRQLCKQNCINAISVRSVINAINQATL
ncbi:glycosyltransferase family 9 protein [Arenicellales bacterium nBUS_48]